MIWFNIFNLDEPQACRSLKFHFCLRSLAELLTARNDNPPLHASPTSKSNEIVLLEISLQSIRPALGSDCTFKQRCLPACLPRLPAEKETNKNNQNQRQRNGKGSSPRWDKRTRRGLSSWEWLAIRNVLKPRLECVPQTKEFHWGVVVRCFSLGSASDLVSNCGVADKAGVAGSFLSGAFCYALVPFLSDPPPKAPGNKKTPQILFLHPSAYCFVHKYRLNLTH